MRVAIIGGGLSGTLACLQLLRQSADIHVSLIERRSRQLNRGVAYSSRLSRQLLNVPASRMGLFPEDHGSFLQWARTGPMPGAGPLDFLPRSLFGDYVDDQFHEAIDRHAGRVDIVRADAISLDHHPADGYAILLHNGRTVHADKVVLALGNAPPAHLPGLTDEAIGHQGHIDWPWQHGALNRIGADDAVLFVGSGLTMVDLLLSLIDQGHRGQLIVISRRGLLPRPHAGTHAWVFSSPPPGEPGTTLLELLRWVRSEARLALSLGVPWQCVMDAVKPLVKGWWQVLDHQERGRFLRHARPFWEVHRHRMPAEVHERIVELQRRGRLISMAGGIESIEVYGEGLQACVRTRGASKVLAFRVAHVINCTGPQSDTRRLEQPLLRSMVQKGFAAWDDLRLGLRTTPLGALVDANGAASADLFAIGPLCKATLWECTAVPEIREQADALACTLTAQARVGGKPQRRGLRRLVDRLALKDA